MLRPTCSRPQHLCPSRFLSHTFSTVVAMEIEVIRSARRRKTVQARVVNGVLRVAIPALMTTAEEQHWVDEMRRRVLRDNEIDQIDLSSRATRLATKFGLPEPHSIEWSTRQNTRWGSTTVSTRKVRLSGRLAEYPAWVVDYVIIHELAHLVEPNHSSSFWALVDRYPLSERSRGYLIARGEMGE